MKEEQKNQNAVNLESVSLENKNPVKKKASKIGIIISVIGVIIAIVAAYIFIPMYFRFSQYNKANDLIAEGEYSEAYEILKKLEDYKDCEELVKRFRYIPIKISEQYVENGTNAYTEEELCELFFNNENLPIQIIGTYIGDSDYGEYIDKYIYDITYDENTNITNHTYTGPAGDKSINEYIYDGGNCIKKVHESYYENYYINYIYDYKDRLIKEVRVSSSGDEAYTEYTYDINDNLIKAERINYFIFDTVSKYTYDTNGNLLKEVCTYSTGLEIIKNYTYDDNGNLIQENEGSIGMYGNSSTKVINYTYDAKNKLIGEERIYSDGSKSTCHYTYDKNGNLVNRTNVDSEGNQTVTCIEYKFVYIPYEHLSDDVEAYLVSNIIYTLFDY